MNPFVTRLLKYLILSVLIIVFLFTLILGAIVFTKPTLVIQTLEHLVPTATPAPQIRMTGIGVLGDSQSDEYRADDNRGYNYSSTTLNWVELLVNERKVNFGEWGVWGEPRRSGYAYNFARTGATSRSMITSGQHIGLAEYIKEGKVNVVVIYIGANDFAPYNTHDGYEAIYGGTISQAAILDKQNRIVSDVTTAIDTIRQAGNVRIIHVLIPDWGRHAGIKAAFPFPGQRQRVSEAIAQTNEKLQAVARERNILTIDPNRFFDNLPRDEKGSRIVVGDVSLDELMFDNNPRNLYVDDGVHTGTLLNGLFANEILRSLNMQITNKVRPLSDQEILSAAGIIQNAE